MAFAYVQATADGSNAIVAAVTGKQIVVASISLSNENAATQLFTIRSGASTVLWAPQLPATDTRTWAGSRQDPLFATTISEALNVVNPAGVDSRVSVTYYLL